MVITIYLHTIGYVFSIPETRMKIYPVNIERFSNHSTASGFHEDLRGVFKRWKHTPVDLFTEDGYYVNNLKESVEVTTGRGLTFGDWDALLHSFCWLSMLKWHKSTPTKKRIWKGTCVMSSIRHMCFFQKGLTSTCCFDLGQYMWSTEKMGWQVVQIFQWCHL